MATRTSDKQTSAKKTPAKKTAPRKATQRKTVPAAELTTDDRPTIVDLRHPLPVRRRLFTGPMGVQEQAAIRAALAARAIHLPVPVRTWNGSTAQLADGTLLIHNSGPDRTFTAHIACRHGAIHGHPITSHTDLHEARAVTHACERPHGPEDADSAITHGVTPAPTPKLPAVLALREGVRRAEATKTDMQARVDADQPKEHPQP